MCSFINAIKLISTNCDIVQTPIKPTILPWYDWNFGPRSKDMPCCQGQNFHHTETILQVLWGFEIYQNLSWSAWSRWQKSTLLIYVSITLSQILVIDNANEIRNTTDIHINILVYYSRYHKRTDITHWTTDTLLKYLGEIETNNSWITTEFL